MTSFTAVSNDELKPDEQDVDESEYAEETVDEENVDTDDETTEVESETETEAIVEDAKPVVSKRGTGESFSKKEEVLDTPYQVLYRRFRPHKFADIMGQENIVKALRSAVINKKIANVYLFCGERGTGKTSTARVFASALNCPNAKNGEPCGVCDLCVNVRAGNGSTGITELDAASNSSVDDIRTLINNIQFATAANKNVYIIDEVHLLSNQANGTLLKTLEEPPSNVVFILCTTNPERLQAAIRSRATVMNFREFDDATMQKLIEDVASEAEIDITAEQISGVVRKGKGSPRDALSALEALSLNTDAKVEHQNHAALITSAIDKKDVAKIVIAVANAIEGGGKSVTEISTDLLSYWRSALLVLNAPEVVRLTDEEFDSVQKVAESIGTDSVIYMMRSLGEAHSRLNQGDPRVMLETALIQFVIPHTDAAAIKDIGRKVDGLVSDVADLRKRPTSSPFDTKVTDDKWLDEEKPTAAQKDREPEEAVATPKAESSAPKKSSYISDPDELIDAIFDAAGKKFALEVSDLDVDRETNSEKLVLKTAKDLTDKQFQLLDDVLEKLDSRPFELKEGQ